MTRYIKADEFYYPYQVKKAGYLAIEGGTFGDWQAEVPGDADIVDYTGYSIAPGLVDTHVHGFAGADVMDNSKEALETMSHALLGAEVINFLPTGLTASFETLDDICRTAADFAGQESGTRIQGFFFEGPYFTEKYKGAQNPSYTRNPSTVELDQWLGSSKGLLRKITLAPERDDVADFINHAKEKNVVVALGRPDATYEQAADTVEAGASAWVHTYNGMRGLNHHEPGTVGAVYESPNICAELICNEHYVYPSACDILMYQKSCDHVALITDCMSAGNLRDGDYMFGEYPVTVEKETVRLKSDGALVDSILQLKDAVENTINWGITSKTQAISMAGLTPAIPIGISDKCEQIRKGHQADFIVFDKRLDLQTTYLGGEKIWNT